MAAQYLGKLVSPQLQKVHDRLAQMLGGNFEVTSMNQEWLSVRAFHLTPQGLFQAMMQHERELFPEGTETFAILCPSNPAAGSQIHIHDLSKGCLRSEFMTGFCYY